MAIVINGSGTVTGLSVGGLPDGTVDSDTIATGTIVDADVANVAASKLTGALPAISGASLTNLPSKGKNHIINGGFDVWQRGTSFSSDVYGADRWKMYSPSSHAYTRSTDVPTAASPRFKYSASITGSGDGTGFKQYIESANSSRLLGQDVTVSFWLKHTTGSGTDKFKAQLYTLNSLDNGSSGTSIGSTLFTSTTSWAKYTTTFSNLAANTVNGLQLTLKYNGSGSTVALITGVQLELGSVATDFEHRSYGEELALCQRYYQRTARYTTFAGFSNGGSNTQFGVPLSVPLRNTPTVTIENASGTNSWSARHNGGENGNASTCNVEKWEADCTTVHLQMGSFGSNSDMYVNNLYSGNRSIQMDSEL